MISPRCLSGWLPGNMSLCSHEWNHKVTGGSLWLSQPWPQPQTPGPLGGPMDRSGSSPGKMMPHWCSRASVIIPLTFVATILNTGTILHAFNSSTHQLINPFHLDNYPMRSDPFLTCSPLYRLRNRFTQEHRAREEESWGWNPGSRRQHPHSHRPRPPFSPGSLGVRQHSGVSSVHGDILKLEPQATGRDWPQSQFCC